MIFLVCSEVTYGKLQSDVREYLACSKIRGEYASQLEKDQKEDIDRRIKESSGESDKSLVAAYSIAVKHCKEWLRKLL